MLCQCGCGNQFEPTRPWQKYATGHKKRAYRRRKGIRLVAVKTETKREDEEAPKIRRPRPTFAEVFQAGLAAGIKIGIEIRRKHAATINV